MSHPDARPDPLRQWYADLLSEAEGDSSLVRLVRDLDRLSDIPVPSHVQARISRAIFAEAADRYAQRGSRRFAQSRSTRRPRLVIARGMPFLNANKEMPSMKIAKMRRLALVAAVTFLAVLLLSGGGAYALSQLDPGLAKQLGIPVATGPEYTKLEITHTVGDTPVTLSRAAFTTKKVIIGYTYDVPNQGEAGTGICALALTSREGDTFQEFAEDHLGQGLTGGVAHGSTVMYFNVVHLAAGSQDRHLLLTLHPCEGPLASNAVAFEFTVPLQTTQTAAN